MLASLENISLKIGKKKILSDINLQLTKNKITTLVGPNGGGKTSMARILLGILQPTSGRVFVAKNTKIGYMPQKIEVDKTIPLKAIDFINLFCEKTADSKTHYLAKKLRVDHCLNQQIQDLSGGELQKILLLRSLMNKPDLLVLDEPTQYMDVNATSEFYEIIEEVRRENSCAILLISHDLHTVMQKTDIVFCINHHICCHGTPQEVDKHPDFLSLFGNKSKLAIYHHHHDHHHDH